MPWRKDTKIPSAMWTNARKNKGADDDLPKACADCKSPSMRGVNSLRVYRRPFLSILVGEYDTAKTFAGKI